MVGFVNTVTKTVGIVLFVVVACTVTVTVFTVVVIALEWVMLVVPDLWMHSV